MVANVVKLVADYYEELAATAARERDRQARAAAHTYAYHRCWVHLISANGCKRATNQATQQRR
eukprot:2532311-Pleurochrysis_carterae.AAC.2